MNHSLSNPVPGPARSFRGLLTASCAAVLLTACASFDGIAPSSQLQQPANYAAAESLPGQHGQWPDASWARALGGEPLQSLIDEALAGNPGLQVAQARVAAAKAAAEVAGANGDPVWSATFDATYQRYTENGIIPPPLAGSYKTDSQLALNFSYDFDFWGRHAAEFRSAISQDKAAQAEQYNARLVISTAVARAWVQLAQQYEQRDLNQQQLEVGEKLQKLARLRYDAGLDAKSDEEQIKQLIASLRATQAQLDEAIVLTRNQLAALMGQGPDRGLRIPRPTLPVEEAIALPDELPLTLLGRRPDITAARWRVEAAQGDIDAAKTAFYPNVNLVAFAGFSAIGLDNLLESGSRVAGIGPAISVPILDSTRLRGGLKQRVATYDAQVATYNQTLTEALHDVADQVKSLQSAIAQSRQQELATQAAANTLQLARDRERVGTTNMLPVLQSQLFYLFQKRIDLDSQARRSEMHIALIKALGGGFDSQAQGLIHDAHDNNSSSNNDSPSVSNAS
ncbi:efflux transporter outer membrane subunit [Oxalicibacterium solurbis]|uniref:MarR family transcriptional regulator n=1 Tax=Oxalicibacterium solurbis TaxID=69280 RepID=A0A8J3AXJ6_9BURK|nr:efflux transporter outer membrane subunit [Oxalicibacterium solurbis]GGI53361.1 MarR family transcriptional regulator [Oxalicibacterium solurbis]